MVCGFCELQGSRYASYSTKDSALHLPYFKKGNVLKLNRVEKVGELTVIFDVYAKGVFVTKFAEDEGCLRVTLSFLDKQVSCEIKTASLALLQW